MFGPAIGRANQGGRGGSKPRCCMFEQTPRGQDDDGGGEGGGGNQRCAGAAVFYSETQL